MAQALRQETAPGLAKHLAYCARAYALDLALTAAIFIAVSIAAGRVWRFPFDDELYNLAQYERLPFIKLALYYLAGNDVHPPLAYVFGDALHLASLSEPGMRLVSLALTCASLVLLQLVALALVSERRDIAPPTRLAAILLFGLNALAVSQGDALRWYPLFACEAALFVLFALAGDAARFRIAAAIALGLALSTNYLALALALPFAVYRYVLQRRFAWRSDAAFWGVAALFGSLGAISLAALLLRHAPLIASQIGPNPVVALATDLLGFFGGHALGLSQAWMVVPAMAIAAGAIVLTIHRARRDDPAHLLILLLLMALLLPLGGFAKPRSFCISRPFWRAC